MWSAVNIPSDSGRKSFLLRWSLGVSPMPSRHACDLDPRCLWPMRQDLREAAALCRRSIPSRTGLGRVSSELFYPPGDVAYALCAASTIPLHVLQQAILHGPDHHLLFRIDSQFVLNAIDRVPGGHDLVALGLGDLGV